MPKAKPKTKEPPALTRPPIVVVLGHIDHGKTTLLDYIRKTKVAAGEAGAITQHIGAYQVVSEGHTVTFLDTPGHEAFVGVRTRGLNMADVAVLVVAADEGVKEQTKEAIKLIHQSKLPFVVAFNKIDKPEAQLQRVKKQLGDEGVFIEEWGGDVPAVEVSAKTGQGVNHLLEIIALLGELHGLTADPQKPAHGTVLDSRRDAQRGPVVSLLVRDGTLRPGDIVVAGSTFGRLRRLTDAQGRSLATAPPAGPVQVIGLKEEVLSGALFQVVSSLKAAEQAARAARQAKPALSERRFTVPPEDTVYLILKADQHGSLEAIRQALSKMAGPEAHYKVIREGLGSITGNDVEDAIVDQAIVLGFNVAVAPEAAALARLHTVNVQTFNVIYDLIDTVKAALAGKLKPVLVRHEVASLKVLAVFRREKAGMIVGGRVQEGAAKRGVKMEIIRNEAVVGRGVVKSLRQEKEEVSAVGKGRDCGLNFEGDPVVAEGDVLKLYEEKSEIPKLAG